MDPVAELMRIEVGLAEFVCGIGRRVPDSPPEGAPEATIWCDYGFKWPAHTLVHLYRTAHPENPLHGQDG